MANLQARTRALFTSIPLGLIILNNEAVIEAVNPALASMLNRAECEFFGHQLSFIFRKSAVKKLFEALPTSNKQDRFELLELEIATKDKEIIIVDVSGNSFQADGSTKIVLTLKDASERIQLEQFRHQLLNIVSHDLRAPLASFHCFLNSLKMGDCGELTQNGLEKLQIAEAGIARLNRMIRDLLEMAKLESGAIKLVQTSFAAGEFIQQTTSAINDLARSKCIDLKVSNGDAEIFADRERLSQVLTNFLANAIQYSPAGTTVLVSTKQLSDGDVEISVADSGPGITAGQEYAIFDPFLRLAGTAVAHPDGIGLGLNICKQIVELHGGTIGCTSNPQGGSTFWLRLPPKPKHQGDNQNFSPLL
ncbi:MAG: PAS domain-containing sensor histidine kinase [Candidatus Obscuribacterales bacterium]|nr:PAS domain-containing sensor histidine kinase [Candidatus Obscuribacterales bacterium]